MNHKFSIVNSYDIYHALLIVLSAQSFSSCLWKSAYSSLTTWSAYSSMILNLNFVFAPFAINCMDLLALVLNLATGWRYLHLL